MATLVNLSSSYQFLAILLFSAFFVCFSDASSQKSSINVPELLQFLKTGDYVRVKDRCTAAISTLFLYFF